MKKTVALILIFVLVSGLVKAQRTEETARLEKINLKRIESENDALGGKIDKDL